MLGNTCQLKASIAYWNASELGECYFRGTLASTLIYINNKSLRSYSASLAIIDSSQHTCPGQSYRWELILTAITLMTEPVMVLDLIGACPHAVTPPSPTLCSSPDLTFLTLSVATHHWELSQWFVLPGPSRIDLFPAVSIMKGLAEEMFMSAWW